MTISEYREWLINNKSIILLKHSIGEELAEEIISSKIKFEINEDRSISFFDCPPELLQRIEDIKKI